MELMFTMLVPGLMLAVALWGLYRRVDLWGALTDGAEKGLKVSLRIMPPLIGLLTAVYMLRASGALELLGEAVGPLLSAAGIPVETIGLLLVRPVSDLRPGFPGGADGGGDAGLHRDHVLHHRGVFWRGQGGQDPVCRPGGAVRGYRRVPGGVLGGAAAVLSFYGSSCPGMVSLGLGALRYISSQSRWASINI